MRNFSVDDDALWDGLVRHVRATRGHVGISKMLGTRDDEEAKRVWVGSVRPVLEKVAGKVPLSSAGTALFEAPDGVSVQLDISQVIIAVDGSPRVRTLIAADPSSVFLSAAAETKWPTRWASTLALQGSAQQVVWADDLRSDSSAFPWIAQKPGTPGPWTSAATEQEAVLAGLAEDLGFDRVSSLFREFEVGSRV